MENGATIAGLKLKSRPSGGEWKWEDLETVMPIESLTSAWRILEYLPIKRLSFKEDGSMTRQVFSVHINPSSLKVS